MTDNSKPSENINNNQINNQINKYPQNTIFIHKAQHVRELCLDPVRLHAEVKKIFPKAISSKVTQTGDVKIDFNTEEEASEACKIEASKFGSVSLYCQTKKKDQYKIEIVNVPTKAEEYNLGEFFY